MESDKWDLKKLVTDNVSKFGETYLVREKLFEETDDGETLLALRYLSKDNHKSNFYGIVSDQDCKCGAGHLNLAVLNLKDHVNIPEVARDINSYMKNRYSRMGRQSEFQTNLIFEILAGRSGNRQRGSWDSIFEISGLEIPYDSCRLLVHKLTKGFE